MEKIKTYKINLDSDLNGLSIGKITEFYEGNKKIAESKVHRKAFRKIDDEGNVNENFEKEVDEFTGEKDFVKKKLNF